MGLYDAVLRNGVEAVSEKDVYRVTPRVTVATTLFGTHNPCRNRTKTEKSVKEGKGVKE